VLLTAGGLAAGVAVGWLLSQVLVAVLTGVFDPPPAALTIPWPYLAGTALITVAALGAAAAGALGQGHRPPVRELRQL
jgi:putative ABC transport system permease protein